MSQSSEKVWRDAESYRREARAGLKGKWKRTIWVMLLLMLVSGVILPASVETADGVAFVNVTGAIGPFEETVRIGRYSGSPAASIARDCPDAAFIAAAGILSLTYLIFTPVCELGQVRMSLRAVKGEAIGPDVLRRVPYWKTVRTLLLQLLWGYWPLLLVLGGAAAIPILVKPEDTLAAAALMIVAVLVMAIVSGINSLRFEPAIYLMEMRPRKGARQLIRMSKKLMKGNKGRLFGLNFSFFGWELLAMLPVFAAAVYLKGIGAMEELNSDAVYALVGLTELNWVVLPCQAATLAATAAVGAYRRAAVAAFVRDMAGESDWHLHWQKPESGDAAPGDEENAGETETADEAAEEKRPERRMQVKAVSAEDDPWSEDGRAE